MKIFNKGEVIFNTFEVLELLNSGGMGNVYKVKHVKVPIVFAIKQLKLPPKEIKDILIQSFISEISILKSLKHPNIANLYDSFYHNGDFLYVMEFIEGKDIRTYFNDLPDISEEKIVKYFWMCLNAIDYLHSRNIIHRDIKPSNLMIDITKDIVKIIDFGISNFFGKNFTFVSPGYSPPEQYKNLPFKPYNDIFALGVTFLELISNIRPFESKNYFSIDLHRNYINAATEIAQKKISKEFLDVLLKCVDIDPCNRFQTAQEIIHELNKKNFKMDNTYLTNFYEYTKKIDEIFDQIEKRLLPNFALAEVSRSIDIMAIKTFDNLENTLFFVFKENKLLIYLIPFLGKGILLKELNIDDIDQKIVEELKEVVK